MKYVERSLKGTFGYVRKQRNFEIVKTLVLYAMAFGIFFIGLFTLGTKKSLWSVFAVLALLPACKSLVGVIMLARFKSLTDGEYERYSQAAGDVPALYENILTTGERTFFVPVICIAGGCVTLYYPDKKDETELRDHIVHVMTNAGHNVTVKVFTDEDAFVTRAGELRKKYKDENGAFATKVANTIKAVSL